MIPPIISIVGIIIGTLFGVGIFVLIVFGINGFVISPQKALQSQKDEYEKILEKHNWSKVEFKEVPYHITGITGWAFRITNNKSFDLERIEVRWMLIQTNQEVYSHQANRKAYYFPIIDHENQNMGFYHEDQSLKHGESKDYAITGLVNPATVYEFTTDPKENGIEWPFSNEPYPEVTIDIRLIAHTEYERELNHLPFKFMTIEIKHDGEIKIKREPNERPA